MPIYEFECLDCGSSFEEIVSLFPAHRTNCPICDSGRTRRIISGFCHLRGKAPDGSSRSGGEKKAS